MVFSKISVLHQIGRKDALLHFMCPWDCCVLQRLHSN